MSGFDPPVAEARRECARAVADLAGADEPDSHAAALYYLGLLDLDMGRAESESRPNQSHVD